MKEVTIAYIGGGSQLWALNLMADLALQDSLTGKLILHDIDGDAARSNAKVGETIFQRDESKTAFAISVEDELELALEGADFVVISIEPGDIEMRYADLEIPAKYGIHQTVGDSVGPGGIVRAVRAIPLMKGFAHAVMRQCPEAWVINYTNPMAWCTAALFAAEPDIKAIGCCHEIFGTQELIANWLAAKLKVDVPERHDIQLDIAGVNHFTFATAAYWRGEDVLPRLAKVPRLSPDIARSNAQSRKDREAWYVSDSQVGFEFLRRFGALGAAGDRHLVEFVPWYLRSEADLHSWGVIMTPYEWRVRRTKTQDEARAAFLGKPLACSGEEGVALIAALAGQGAIRTNVNVLNTGQYRQAPLGTLIECYAMVSQNRIEHVQCAELPQAIQTLVDRNLAVQQLVLEGVLSENRQQVYTGLSLDPLVALPTDVIEKMMTEMFDYMSIDW